jgi:2,4-dienoyl-CoA reductase (NADPH2)
MHSLRKLSFRRGLYFQSVRNQHDLFPNIFNPMSFGNIEVKNRIIMGSMHTGLEEGKLEELALFYSQRARGEAGMIVTGGISPNIEGSLSPGAARMTTEKEAESHRLITSAVHNSGESKICMQILHAGRYGKTKQLVAPSSIRSPINRLVPRELTTEEVYRTIDDYVKTASLAKHAGYDGVEIMGSEGYFINQFLVTRTNQRKDEFGGSYENRMRLPIEIVKRIRKEIGPNFIIIYRLSLLDLVEDGSSWEETQILANAIKEAGASIINTGIGWHEAPIPTIGTMVPRATFTLFTQRMKAAVPDIPFCTSNRINTPEMIETILSNNVADFVSMARPFLADPEFVLKSKEKRSNEINTCIACNQACLDHIFQGKTASCLVNPFAGHEKDLIFKPVSSPEQKRNIAVIGAGPAGLAFATTAAKRGHSVTLYEKDSIIGGQFNMAKFIPGKEEFFETLRYFSTQLSLNKVNLKLKTEATIDILTKENNYDAIVLATGVYPRDIQLPVKTEKVKVYSYIDVLRHKVPVGDSVAVIGAGGIGYDVSEFIAELNHLPHPPASDTLPVDEIIDYFHSWGIDPKVTRGGLENPSVAASSVVKSSSASSMPGWSPEKDKIFNRKIYLLQRKPKFGVTLGKTTGWIHRLSLKKKDVQEMGGITRYIEVNDKGLVIEYNGETKTLPVDTVIISAGQVVNRDLHDALVKSNKPIFLIGGSYEALELDAKRAIDQGTRLACNIENAKSGDVFKAPDDKVHGGLNVKDE